MFETTVAIVRQHTRWEENWSLNRVQRFGYTVKALICLMLRRWRSGSSCRKWDSKEQRYPDYDGCTCRGGMDPVSVAQLSFQGTYSMEFGSGAEWDEVVVGYGVLRNWHLHMFSTGYP